MEPVITNVGIIGLVIRFASKSFGIIEQTTIFKEDFKMKRNLFKKYAIVNNEVGSSFRNDQNTLNTLGIRFNVCYFKNNLGIIAIEVNKGSSEDKILKERGFVTGDEM